MLLQTDHCVVMAGVCFEGLLHATDIEQNDVPQCIVIEFAHNTAQLAAEVR
jgi:hypothetical protein